MGLLALGAMMVFLPILQEVKYSPGQTFASITQGFAILLFSAISLLESIYSTRWVRNWFGFLTYTSGRLFFYITVGLYALPVLETLSEASKSATEGEGGNVNILEVMAFVGIICSFVTGFLHIVYFGWKAKLALKREREKEKDMKHAGEKTEGDDKVMGASQEQTEGAEKSENDASVAMEEGVQAKPCTNEEGPLQQPMATE